MNLKKKKRHRDQMIVYFILFIYVWLGLCCFEGFSLVAVSRGYPLLVVHRLLTVVASLAEHRL